MNPVKNPSLLSPRQRFQSDAATTKAHLDYTDSRAFTQAADMAMLQLVESLPDVTDATIAIAAYNRVVGARMFRRIFASLSHQEPPVETKRNPLALDHSA